MNPLLADWTTLHNGLSEISFPAMVGDFCQKNWWPVSISRTFAMNCSNKAFIKLDTGNPIRSLTQDSTFCPFLVLFADPLWNPGSEALHISGAPQMLVERINGERSLLTFSFACLSLGPKSGGLGRDKAPSPWYVAVRTQEWRGREGRGDQWLLLYLLVCILFAQKGVNAGQIFLSPQVLLEIVYWRVIPSVEANSRSQPCAPESNRALEDTLTNHPHLLSTK